MKYFAPPEHFTGEDIAFLRKQAGMTRSELASYLGVTAKAVEAWEYGKSSPSGAVCRLMAIFAALDPGEIRAAEKVLPFETLSPEEVHFLDGRTFLDPRFNITVTWEDGGDLLYLNFNYRGRKYHPPARPRYREDESAFAELCRAGSDIIENYVTSEEWTELTRSRGR